MDKSWELAINHINATLLHLGFLESMMKNEIAYRLLTLYTLAAILLITLLQQSLVQFNCDISYAMTVIPQLLSGKHYFTDFINTNPPLSFLIYLPAYLLQKTHLSMRVSMWVYLFALIIFSLSISAHQLKKINYSNSTKRYILIAIAATLTLLQCYEFGQRAHIALLFIMPYLLMAVNRLEKHDSSLQERILIIIISTIGFLLNPFYLILFICCELLLWVRGKERAIETIVLVIAYTAYVFLIKVFFPNYFQKIVPIGYYIYLPGYRIPWYHLLSQATTMYAIVILCLSTYTLFRRKTKKSLLSVFTLATVAFIITDLSQQKIFYYHQLPAFTMSVILAVILLTTWFDNFQHHLKRYNLIATFDFRLFLPLIFLFPPFFITLILSWGSIAYHQSDYLQIKKFILQNTKPKEAILFLTYKTRDFYPLLQEIDRRPAYRFDAVWFLPGIVKQPNNPIAIKQGRLLTDIMINDVIKANPKLIFIDKEKKKFYFNNTSFDYLNYFKQDVRFRKTFRKYHLIGHLDQYQIFSLPKN